MLLAESAYGPQLKAFVILIKYKTHLQTAAQNKDMKNMQAAQI